MTSAVTLTAHEVETYREGDWWLVRVPGLDANYTQARTLEEVEEMARDLIALTLDIDETEVGEIVITKRDWRSQQAS